MGSDWKTLSLESCMEAIIDYRGKTPKKTKFGIPLITAKIIKSGRIEPTNEFIAESDYESWMRRGIPKSGDIVMTTEAPLGEVAQLDDSKIALAQRVITLRGKSGLLDNNFLKYLLLSHDVQSQLEGRATGTTVRGIKQSELRKVILHFPDYESQKQIALILGTLDDKIELNRQTNTTLEAMAQALFKSWFVDFDPVIDNALAAGNLIPEPLQARSETRKALGDQRKSLPDDLQKQFPDRFILDEEMGWIPKGWYSGPVSQLCLKVQNGGTPRRDNPEYWNEGTIPWLTSGEVRQTIITTVENKITESGFKNSSAKWLPAGSTVIAMYGATAGQVAFVATPITTNQAVCGLIPKEDYRFFNYLSLERVVASLENQARGSAQQNISKGIIENTTIIIPPAIIAEILENQVYGYFEKWFNNLDVENTLTKLRDTILPKLLSGELRLPEAEAIIDQQLAEI